MSKTGLHLLGEAELDEATLIDRARGGDRDAQEVLVRRHLSAVYALALRILGEPDLAQDATQDALVNALHGLARFRGESSFRTWLLRIAANSAKSLGRRRWRKRESTLDAAQELAGDDDPAHTAEVGTEAARATELLARLPPKQRMAVELRVNQGLSYAEVGQILDCSEGAARVNYHLGIKRLREMMS